MEILLSGRTFPLLSVRYLLLHLINMLQCKNKRKLVVSHFSTLVNLSCFLLRAPSNRRRNGRKNQLVCSEWWTFNYESLEFICSTDRTVQPSNKWIPRISFWLQISKNSLCPPKPCELWPTEISSLPLDWLKYWWITLFDYHSSNATNISFVRVTVLWFINN